MSRILIADADVTKSSHADALQRAVQTILARTRLRPPRAAETDSVPLC